jgi:hypothetical protein
MEIKSCFYHLKYSLGYRINFGIKQCKLFTMLFNPEASAVYSNAVVRPVKD